jgi:hypothetical protein
MKTCIGPLTCGIRTGRSRLLRRALHTTWASRADQTDLHRLLYTPLPAGASEQPQAEDPMAARNALQAALSKVRPLDRFG